MSHTTYSPGSGPGNLSDAALTFTLTLVQPSSAAGDSWYQVSWFEILLQSLFSFCISNQILPGKSVSGDLMCSSACSIQPILGLLTLHIPPHVVVSNANDVSPVSSVCPLTVPTDLTCTSYHVARVSLIASICLCLSSLSVWWSSVLNVVHSDSPLVGTLYNVLVVLLNAAWSVNNDPPCLYRTEVGDVR